VGEHFWFSSLSGDVKGVQAVKLSHDTVSSSGHPNHTSKPPGTTGTKNRHPDLLLSKSPGNVGVLPCLSHTMFLQKD